MAVGSNGLNLLTVYDVSDPTNTNDQIGVFNLTAAPQGIAIGVGIAFVAGGTAGLVVVNYSSFDALRQPPAVSFTPPTDLDPMAPGIQVLEGSVIPVRAAVSDDVQVRSVELLVNGQVVRTDVSFPFDLTAFLPARTMLATTATLQVRATDTGGNIGLSSLVTVDLAPDTFAPTVSQFFPETRAGRRFFRSYRITFSESMDSATLAAANIRLVNLADPGAPIPVSDVQFRSQDSSVQLTVGELPVGNYRIILAAPSLHDRAGNPLGAADVTHDFIVVEATATWVNPVGGSWHTPANWQGGIVPGPADDVLIPDLAGNQTITFSSGSSTINSIVSHEPFTLSGGTLTIEADSSLEARST